MTSPTTALQAWSKRAFALLADARDELNDDEYQALVAILHERVETEILRLARGEMLRLTRRPWA